MLTACPSWRSAICYRLSFIHLPFFLLPIDHSENIDRGKEPLKNANQSDSVVIGGECSYFILYFGHDRVQSWKPASSDLQPPAVSASVRFQWAISQNHCVIERAVYWNVLYPALQGWCTQVHSTQPWMQKISIAVCAAAFLKSILFSSSINLIDSW